MSTKPSRHGMAIGKPTDDVRIFDMKKTLLTAMMMFGSLSPAFAQGGAKPPVIVEMFGKNACGDDDITQRHVENVIRQYDNAILINCRKYHDWDQVNTQYNHTFCTDRMRDYRIKFRVGTQSTVGTMVVVNGQWDANSRDVAPAVRLGATDNITPLNIERLDETKISLDFPMTEGALKTKGAHIVLYAYAPSTRTEEVTVDADAQLNMAMIEKIKNRQSVPFVGETVASDYYFRPVVARHDLGLWHGEAKKLVVSLDEIDLLKFDDTPNADLSFVVSVHEGDSMGRVIAGGELMSDVEKGYLLPRTDPIEFKYVTPENPLMQ